MSAGHEARLLLAESSYEMAKGLRDQAAETLRLAEKAYEYYSSADLKVPAEVIQDVLRATLEYKQMNRVCLRHAARRYDMAFPGEEMESHVLLFDITTPVRSAA